MPSSVDSTDGCLTVFHCSIPLFQCTLGTNPISVAAPAKHGDSFVLDMATSAVALGKVRKRQMLFPNWHTAILLHMMHKTWNFGIWNFVVDVIWIGKIWSNFTKQ